MLKCDICEHYDTNPCGMRCDILGIDPPYEFSPQAMISLSCDKWRRKKLFQEDSEEVNVTSTKYEYEPWNMEGEE